MSFCGMVLFDFPKEYHFSEHSSRLMPKQRANHELIFDAKPTGLSIFLPGYWRRVPFITWGRMKLRKGLRHLGIVSLVMLAITAILLATGCGEKLLSDAEKIQRAKERQEKSDLLAGTI